MDTDEVVNITPQSNQAVETAPIVPSQPTTTPISTSTALPVASHSTPLAQLSSVPPPQLAIDPEPLPRVLIGSEPWHAHVPNSWVPMITRDMGRQRRNVS